MRWTDQAPNALVVDTESKGKEEKEMHPNNVLTPVQNTGH